LAKPTDAEDAPNMGKQKLERATEPERGDNNRWSSAPVDATLLLTTLGPAISTRTRDTVAGNQSGIRAALLLGSPDFMRH
jgi:hypothetical protein